MRRCVLVIAALGLGRPPGLSDQVEDNRPWRRPLTGEEAEKVNGLEKQIEQLIGAGKLFDALSTAKVVESIRTGNQGKDHWESVNAAWRVRTLAAVVARTPAEQEEYRSLRTSDLEAEGLWKKNRYSEAVVVCEKALGLRKKLLGEEHPDTANGYNNLAFNLKSQGKHVEAQPLFEKSLALRKKLLGEEHPDTAFGYNNLALDLCVQGKQAEALEQWLLAEKSFEAARLCVATSGLGRAEFSAEMNPLPHLASALARDGKTLEAWKYLERSLARGLLDDLSAREARKLTAEDRDRERKLVGEIEGIDARLFASKKTAATSAVARLDSLRTRRLELQFELSAFEKHLVEAIAGKFPGRVEKLLGTDASKPRLRELLASGKLAKYRYLHFATHGVPNRERAFDSALILSRVPEPAEVDSPSSGVPVDGRLTAGEILRSWSLNADLVVLSACQSAVGQHAGGEGYLGFSQALLLSGAKGVVLSLWKVDDTATALLMERLYDNIWGTRPGLGGGMGRAEALREAQIWLRGLGRKEARDLAARQGALALAKERGGNDRGTVRPRKPVAAESPSPGTGEAVSGPAGEHPYADPYFWAAFILIGNPD